MLRIRPYKACDASIITKWLKNEFLFRQWCADRYDTYPITPEAMNQYYDQDKNHDWIWGMTAFDESGIVGHFIMRFTDQEKRIVRLGFVIVDDSKRNKGYGKELLLLAIQYAFQILKVKKITLGVFENNLSAIYCYQAVGFHIVPQDLPETYNCLGEVWNCLEMELYNDLLSVKNETYL